MARDSRYKDFLDYTVTYKSMWTIVGLVVALAVAGWFAWQKFKPAGPDEKARQVIKDAGRLEKRAGDCVQDSTPATFLGDLQAGREKLAEARTLFEAGRYADAAAAADKARDGLREFNDQVCSTVESVARFIGIKGQIKIKTAKSPRWVTASRSTRLQPGDRVRVDAGEALIEYQNGEKHTLKKGAMYQIQDYRLKPGGGATADILFESGELLAEGVTNGDSIIRTDKGEARPKAGDISIELSEDGRQAKFRSKRGGSEVRADGVVKQLGEVSRLETVKTSSGRLEVGEVQDDLLGPDLREPIDGRHFIREEPAKELTFFEWRPADGAETYVFRLGRNDWFEPVLNEGDERVPQGRVDLREAAEIMGLPTGTYYWKVAGVTAEGDFGRWSQTFRFTVTQGKEEIVERDPPMLEVDAGIALGDKYIFKGKCDPYARLQVFVNGKRWGDIDLGDDGGFQAMIPVEYDGWNTITFEAQDTYGTKNPQERKVYWSGI